jgi:hypothetical protein
MEPEMRIELFLITHFLFVHFSLEELEECNKRLNSFKETGMFSEETLRFYHNMIHTEILKRKG